MLYGDPKYGGFNMIKIKEFFLTLEVNWVHKHVNGLDDNWADLIDLKLDIKKEQQVEISKLGSEHPKINKLIKLELPGISLFFVP